MTSATNRCSACGAIILSQTEKDLGLCTRCLRQKRLSSKQADPPSSENLGEKRAKALKHEVDIPSPIPAKNRAKMDTNSDSKEVYLSFPGPNNQRLSCTISPSALAVLNKHLSASGESASKFLRRIIYSALQDN